MTNQYKPTQLMIDWVAKLREPDLEQTDGALCKTDADGNKSYCCLGVLEEVAGNETRPQAVVMRAGDGVQFENLAFYGLTAQGETGLPNPALIAQVLGHDPVGFMGDNIALGVDEDAGLFHASEANDDYHWTFDQIAYQLEKVYINGTGDPSDYTIEDARLADTTTDY
jgi:hypothetical protein